MNIILYGPPNAGKTTVGRALAGRLRREFLDCDPLIESRAGLAIPQIFAERGEAEFRRIESAVCTELGLRNNLIIAPGGGALVDPANRAALERNGLIVCLQAGFTELLQRMGDTDRPLLSGNSGDHLRQLLESRCAVYDSFPVQLDTTGKTVEQVVDEITTLLQPITLNVDAPALKHSIQLGYGLLESLPEILRNNGLTGPAVIVTDQNVAAQFPTLNSQIPITILPPGEQHKTLAAVQTLYDAFIQHGLDRTGTVIALGGGVIGDTAGFAAATYMRGVPWVNIPTTLLAMVDASLGGKTGVDLPQGKNLVGAFHPPAMVISDPLLLNTLPREEWIAGLGEVIKHGIIDAEDLFIELEQSARFGSLAQLQRAIAVKVRVVNADPFERGRRATLNLGHTIGHGVEAASEFRLRHGEAIAIGLVAECRLAEALGLAASGLTERIICVLRLAGLPVNCPGLDPVRIRTLMSSDKKKAGGKLKFALPRRIGEVVWGVEVDEESINASAARDHS